MGRRAIPGHVRPALRRSGEVRAAKPRLRRGSGSGSVSEHPCRQARPIIIKKKAAHGGHHGGAWKVAYADFVTAMMALFIVLWLLNSSKQIQEAVGGYFKDPTGTAKKVGTATERLGRKLHVDEREHGAAQGAAAESYPQDDELRSAQESDRDDSNGGGSSDRVAGIGFGNVFRKRQFAVANDSGKELLVTLAGELAKLPNTISIEGHTDSKPYVGTGSYSNWELSADRANAARRLMQENGVRRGQVSQVRGFADQSLRKKDDPEDPSNRRITILVQYLPKPEGESAPERLEATPARDSK